MGILYSLTNEETLLDPFKTERRGEYLYEYFRVEVPEEVYPTLGAQMDAAIHLAREECSVYRVPCQWSAMADDNPDYIVVERMSRD